MILRVIVIVSATFLAGCVNYLQNADDAYMRSDWERAAVDYQRALSNSKDPSEIKQISKRLIESKQRASEFYYNKALELEQLGDSSEARKHALKAYEYKPDPETTNLVDRLSIKEQERALNMAKSSMENEDWEGAMRYAYEAQSIRDSNQADSIVKLAGRKLKEKNLANFNSTYPLAYDQMALRNWELADSYFQEAHKYGQNPSSIKEHEFVQLMMEANELISGEPTTFNINRAERKFLEARRFGIDTKYLDQKINDIKLRNYRITFHSALILPFNPSDNKHWDSMESVDPVAELATIGATFYGIPPTYSALASTFLSKTTKAFSPPDPALVITFNNRMYGGASTEIQDEFRPQWEYSMTFTQVNKNDKRVLGLIVYDMDLNEPDKIGDHQFVLGDLVDAVGVTEIIFIEEGQELLAGGLVGLKLSVEQVN